MALRGGSSATGAPPLRNPRPPLDDAGPRLSERGPVHPPPPGNLSWEESVPSGGGNRCVRWGVAGRPARAACSYGA
jgi:hypothetical protein